VGLTSYASITGNTMLGTDGMHSDMLRSAKAAFLVGQSTEGIGFDEIYRRFHNVHQYAVHSACAGRRQQSGNPQL